MHIVAIGGSDAGISAALVENHDQLIRLVQEKVREDPSSHGRPGRVDAVVRQEGDAREGVTGFVEK